MTVAFESELTEEEYAAVNSGQDGEIRTWTDREWLIWKGLFPKTRILPSSAKTIRWHYRCAYNCDFAFICVTPHISDAR
jgi:hypothetical protein